MAHRPTRVFNESDQPFVCTYNSREFLFQPKGGGTFVMDDVVFPDPRSKDEDPEVAKMFKKAVLRKRVPVEMKKNKDGSPVRPKPNWLDVPTGFVDFMRNGKLAERIEESDIVLKTLSEMDKEHSSLMEDKESELKALEEKIAGLKAEERALSTKNKTTTPPPK